MDTVKTKRPSDITTEERFSEFCKINFPGKTCTWMPAYCYVQAGSMWGNNLHYEFLDGKVELHIEGGNWHGIRNYLNSISPIAMIRPRNWHRQNCAWTLERNITCEKELFDAFLEIRNILEHHINSYERNHIAENPVNDTSDENFKLRSSILTITELLEEKLSIPMYQRPYRWTTDNVRQLLEDIFDSWDTNKSRYRIGSVILHLNEEDNLDIVDGQQRITTIALILKACNIDYGPNLSHLRYNHSESFHHIHENLSFIKEWLKESVREEQLINFTGYILKNCEFVEIIVKDRSEAFQMFDSQNGRGKELEPYNLLKAYHIRAMEQNSQAERILSDVRWENAVQYDAAPTIPGDNNIDILHQLFSEQLYRSRQWIKRSSAGSFSKKRIDEFKGFTIDKNHPTNYPYQNPHLLQYLTAKFYHSTLEGTIATSNRFSLGDSDSIDPFASINQTIVNGKCFFDYVETYVELYKGLFLNLKSFQLSEFKRFYYQFCLNYSCNEAQAERLRSEAFAHMPKGQALRTGDSYLRELYKSLIMVLFDRFGEKGLMRYYKTLYRLVYATRLEYNQVRYSTVDKLPHEYFSIICNAKKLSDLVSLDRILNERLSKLQLKFNNLPEQIKDFICNGSK